MTASPAPLVLSVSQSYTIRVGGITYEAEGIQVDPRQVYSPQFQLVSVDAELDLFGDWAPATWETNPPEPTDGTQAQGPFGAFVVVGAGQPDAVNPAAAGLYNLYVQFVGITDTPTFPVPPLVKLTVP